MLIHDTEGNKRYYYEDDYMFFSFAGVNSRKYNLFIINDKKGYEWYTDTGASVKVEKPLYQGYTYYGGTDRSQKKMDLELAAEGLSDFDIKEMLLWLEEGKTGFLIVDWNRYWGYDVVLSKVSNPIQMGGRNGLITFKITFQTIGEFRARAAWDITKTILSATEDKIFSFTSADREETIANEYAIPEMDVKTKIVDNNQNTIVYLPTIGNQYGYIDYILNYAAEKPQQQIFQLHSVDSDLVSKQEVFNYILNPTISVGNDGLNLQYYGRSGYILYNNNQLIELDNNIVQESNSMQGELLKLSGVAPKQIDNSMLTVQLDEAWHEDNNSTVLYSDILHIKPTMRLKQLMNEIPNLYISVSVPKEQEINNLYGTNPYNGGPYPIAYYNWIVYLPWFNSIVDGNITNKTIIDYNTTDIAIIVPKGIPDEYITTTNGQRTISSKFKKMAKIYFGSYNILQIINPEYTNHATLTVHKYNNL